MADNKSPPIDNLHTKNGNFICGVVEGNSEKQIQQCTANLNDKINIVMKRISSWFRNNNLVLNLGKTHLIKFITPKTLEYTLSVTYNNLGLKVDNNVNFLGMYVDRHLNWKQQSEKLLKKLNTACFMLRKLQNVVSEQVLRWSIFLISSLNLNMVLFLGVLLQQ
jgi:hypothetical protein